MAKRVYFIYLAAIALTIISYATMYSSLIYWPSYMVIVSNLSLNYVLVSFGLGGVSGWYMWDKVLVKRNLILRFAGTVIGSFLVVALWLFIMTTVGGFQLRSL